MGNCILEKMAQKSENSQILQDLPFLIVGVIFSGFWDRIPGYFESVKMAKLYKIGDRKPWGNIRPPRAKDSFWGPLCRHRLGDLGTKSLSFYPFIFPKVPTKGRIDDGLIGEKVRRSGCKRRRDQSARNFFVCRFFGIQINASGNSRSDGGENSKKPFSWHPPMANFDKSPRSIQSSVPFS